MTYFNGMFFADGAGLATIDLVVIAFILILGIIGMAKGFTKLFFSLFGTLIVIVGAVLLARPVGSLLVGPFGHIVSDPIANSIAGLDDGQAIQIFTTSIDWANPDNHGLIQIVLERIGIPSTFASLLMATGIFNGMFESFGEAVLAEVLPNAIASLAMTVVAFVFLIIVLSIVIFILRRVLIRLTSFKLFGGINRVLGFLLGVAEAYLIISIILTAVAYIPIEGFLSGLRAQIDQSVVTKFLFENNWIANWLMSQIF